jgi:transposase
LVRQRTSTINILRALLRADGVRLANGSAECVVARLDRLTVPAALRDTIAPLRALIGHLTEAVRTADTDVQRRAVADPTVHRLMTAPGVGPVIALTVAAVLDTPDRFGGDARRVSAFLGLVPSEHSSAERRHRGAITKVGPTELRSLLVQASWSIWRGKSPGAATLRLWAEALAARRGRRIAIVALARRLSRILYAMWRDASAFRFTPAVPR